MPIPDFQTIMLPLLRITGDGNEHSIQELINALAEQFSLTEDKLDALLPSGKQRVFYNRVGWAKTYLAKAGLLEMSRRSYYRITARGKQVLARNPPQIDMKFLEQFPEYLEFREREGGRRRQKEMALGEEEKTPEEILEDAYQEIRDGLAQELLSLIARGRAGTFALTEGIRRRWRIRPLALVCQLPRSPMKLVVDTSLAQ